MMEEHVIWLNDHNVGLHMFLDFPCFQDTMTGLYGAWPEPGQQYLVFSAGGNSFTLNVSSDIISPVDNEIIRALIFLY